MECRFCGTDDRASFEYDKLKRGFWCEVCDGYNYFDEQNRHSFNLILEDKKHGKDISINPNIKFKKQLSPLRYPGGKSKLIDYVYSKLNSKKINDFIEPFAGGANVGLSLLEANVINNLILNDLDFGIYSLFYTINNSPDKLIEKINSHVPTHEDYYAAQERIKNNYINCTILQAAWCLLLVNRLAYSGICKAGPLGGKNGDMNDLLVRWNPQTLITRVKTINRLSDRITVLNMDACELIGEMYWDERTTIFIDPPYFRKGKDLYNHYFSKKEHIRLNMLLDNLYQGMPGADMILTYDNDRFIEDMYLYPDIEKISRKYVI